MTTALDHLRSSLDAMVDDLAALVEAESPSAAPDAVAACGEVVAAQARRLLGAEPEAVVVDGRTHLRWRWGSATKVVVIGHLDTVWPLGTLARWPFEVRDGRASGPGAFDMKAGVVQALHALATLADRDGVTLLLTADEEIGSPSSRALIESTVAGAAAALVAEPGVDGQLKIARKGVSLYRLAVTGRAAHAGLEPEKGANAAVELAHQVLAAAELADPAAGTTVTPTVCSAGTTTNTVPAAAEVSLDVRAASAAEQRRVDLALRAFSTQVPGTSLEVLGGPNRPPLPEAASAELFGRARRLAATLGLPEIGGVAVGGGSDGNFTAGVGVPTLDGLGAVGAGAHAEGEWVDVAAMPVRAALLAVLVDELLHA